MVLEGWGSLTSRTVLNRRGTYVISERQRDQVKATRFGPTLALALLLRK